MSSQIAYSLHGAWNTTRPLQYIAETTFGTTPSASPTFVAAGIVNDFTPTIDDQKVDIRWIGSRYIRNQTGVGHNYGFGFSCYPFNLPMLKYGSEDPAGAGTLDESLSFLHSYKQAVGTTLTEHFVLFKGSKMNSLTLSVNGQGVVTANTSWLCKEITIPDATANAGLTTPDFIEHSDVTTAPLSHIDAGSTPLTVDGTPYAVKSFDITWNNNLVADRFVGSNLIDALTPGNRDVTGSFVIPVGKNLTLETVIRTAEQAPVSASFRFKTGVMFANITELETLSYSPSINADANDTSAWTWNWKAKSAVLATS